MTVRPIRPSRLKWVVAVLLDHFTGLTLEGFARLTDRQIQDLYMHKRDRKDGKIVEDWDDILDDEVKIPDTYEKALQDLNFVAVMFKDMGMSPEVVSKAKKDLEVKYGRSTGDGSH